MTGNRRVFGTAALCVALGGGAAALAAGDAVEQREQAAQAPAFTAPTAIDNPYLPLAGHKRCVYRGRAGDGTRKRSVVTRLARTKRFAVGGQAVEAAIIRDKAFENGKLVERTLDYFAQADDGTVHYLGEDVENIRNRRVVNNGGTWLYGRDTDVLGVAMPADPQVGDQYRLEDVPGVTTESNRIEETGLRAKENGRLYTGVIRIQEFVQPEGEVEYKLYAPGVGRIVEYPPDARVALVRCR